MEICLLTSTVSSKTKCLGKQNSCIFYVRIEFKKSTSFENINKTRYPRWVTESYYLFLNIYLIQNKELSVD